MTKDLKNDVFEIIDQMYNHLKKQDTNPELLTILLKAGQALDNDMPPQIVAAKTINGITLYVLSHKDHYDQETGDNISKLKVISRKGGYKWTANGVGDLRIQF
jgi:Enterocin A Immunity.